MSEPIILHMRKIPRRKLITGSALIEAGLRPPWWRPIHRRRWHQEQERRAAEFVEKFPEMVEQMRRNLSREVVHLNCGHVVYLDDIVEATGSSDVRPGTKTHCPICLSDEYVRHSDGTRYRIGGSHG